jgi:hypothetical protein
MRKLIAAMAFWLLAVNLPAFCQTDITPLKSDILKLKSFYSSNIVEKAYLNFDRPCYTAGDTIYFKAYVTLGEQHQLSSQSGVLYADLIDPKNVIKQSIKLQLQQGLAWGDFSLPDTLSGGNYRIRAYTKLMANETGTCFFDEVIPIVSATSNVAVNTPAAVFKKPDIQFFPEGGKLLTGVESKLAFKAIGPDGLGMTVKGVIADNSGKTAANFSSAHLGMGFITFTPEEGKTYKAKVTFGDGSQSSVDIPAASGNGIVLSIDNSDTTVITVGIRCNSTFFGQNKGKTFGVVMNSGTSVSNVLIKFNNPLLAFDLKKSQFHTGLVQFTLFSSDGQPLSERLAFIPGNQLLKMTIGSDKPAYKTRGKTALTINVKNNSGGAAFGHFSVAVVDESKIRESEINENNILSWLLLSSDLKGYIEQPAYYFENTKSETQASLDILMLTQGFRRFNWDQLRAGKYPQVTFQPERSLKISGSVSTAEGKPVTKDKVILICIDGGPILSQETDSLGRFSFPDLSSSKGNHYIIKESSSKAKNRITWITHQPEPVLVNDYQLQIPSPAILANNSPSGIGNGQVNNVKTSEAIVKTIRKPDIKGDEYDSFRNRLGKADQVISFEGTQTSGSLSDHLNGLLNGVTFSSAQPGAAKAPYLTGAVTFGGGAGKGNPAMLVFVDGVGLPPGSGIDDINLNDVRSVEVYKGSSTSIEGADGMGGILCVYTIGGTTLPVGNEMGISTLNITLPGFYQAREFYNPKYDHKVENLKDLRATIYWNPEIVTDKDGNASFDYYNADGVGTYRVVIEGIDENGNLGRQVYRYKVE